MSASQSLHKAHWWPWAAPLGALVLLGLKYGGLLYLKDAAVIPIASAFLLAAVFAAVHHAEVVALKVGQPFGSILLAIAVTVIEVALIVSMMVSAPPGASSLARDTVFSAVIIVLNGVVGLCLVAGGARHREQEFRVDGTASALSVLATLAVMTLVLPNFTTTKLGPQYAPTQLIFVSVLSLILYGVFVFVQSIRHRDHFLVTTPDGASPVAAAAPEDEEAEEAEPSTAMALISLVFLIFSLVAVVLLAKSLSPALEHAIAAAGLPGSFNGVVIAALVLLPESGAAVIAARANRLQTSLNLALGSAIASIGLTIPVVGAVSLYLGQELNLGLDAEEMVILLLTLIASTLTLSTGRATILQGVVHLVIFGVFLLLAAVP